MTTTTFKVPSGYVRKGKQELLTFRHPVDIREMIEHCTRESHIWFLSVNGTARQAKVNGAVQTWKRDPNRVRVPVKYGLYEYGAFDASDIHSILIPVGEDNGV